MQGYMLSTIKCYFASVIISNTTVYKNVRTNSSAVFKYKFVKLYLIR